MEADAALVFTDTRWEFPDIYRQLNRIEAVTERPVLRLTHPAYPGGLPQYIEDAKFLPSYNARFCTQRFKIETYNLWWCGVETAEQYAAYRAARKALERKREQAPAIDSDLEAAHNAGLTPRLPATMFIGLRADEPHRTGNQTDMDGLTIRYPLRERGMTRAAVLRLCLEYDLLPRYPVYMARGGCIGCFYKRKSEVNAMIALVPEVVDGLQRLEEAVQDERGTFFHMFPNAGASIATLRAQATMFDPDEVYAAALDTSDVGPACGLFCHR